MATSHFHIPLLLLALAFGAQGLTVSAAAGAQAEKTANASAPARPATAEDLPMDMGVFLAGVSDATVQDAVWRFAPAKTLSKTVSKNAPPRQNKMLVVPIRLGKGDYKASTPPVGPGEGRFIAWYLPVSGAKDLPLGAPQVASGFTVTKDGRIRWAVERFTNTMELAGGGAVTDEKSFYSLSLDRARLKALAPAPYKKGAAFVPLPKQGRFEPADVYAARNNAAKAAHVKQEETARAAWENQKANYAAALDKVDALPDQLTAPAPAMVYAVYYAPDSPPAGNYAAPPREKENTFTGCPQGAWKPTPAMWNALVALAKGAGTVPMPEVRKQSEIQLKQVAAGITASRSHPLAVEAASVALAASGLLNGLAPEAEAYTVAGQVLDSKEPVACARVMRALVAADNSPAKAALLVRAVEVSDKGGDQTMSNQLRVSALRVLLRSKETNTDAKRTAALGLAFADAAGAPPSDLLAEFDALFTDKDAAAISGGAQTPERARAMASLVKLQDIRDPKRRRAVLTALAAGADRSPLAAALVDESLRAGSALAPLEVLVALAAAGPGKVPVDQVGHGLLPRLSDSDSDVRAAAWRALPTCVIRPPASLSTVRAANAPAPAADPGILASILDAGLASQPVPAELAVFLAAQAAPEAAARPAALAGLAREMGDGGESGRKQALAFFRQPTHGATLEGALIALDAETRFKAVTGCYLASGQEPPLPAGLLLSAKESERAARWFAAEFAKGGLPLPSQYAGICPDKAQLMDWVMAQDPRLAGAAVALLSYQEGADDAQAAQTAKVMLAEPYKLRAQMERKWETCRNDLFAARVKAMSGQREIRLAVCRKADKAWNDKEVKQVAMQWKEKTAATGVPGVEFEMDVAKKVIMLSDGGLLDRLNPRIRQTLDVGALSGPVEFTWNAPCWEARVRQDADTELLLRVVPVGWQAVPALPDFGEKK